MENNEYIKINERKIIYSRRRNFQNKCILLILSKLFFMSIVILYFFLKCINSKNNNDLNFKKRNKLYKNCLYANNEKLKISILFPYFDKLGFNNTNSKLIIIKYFLNQSLKEIEILISIQKNNSNLYNQMIDMFGTYHSIKIFDSENDIFKDTTNLILKSKGK